MVDQSVEGIDQSLREEAQDHLIVRHVDDLLR